MTEIVFTLSAEIEWFNLTRIYGNRFEKAFDHSVTLLRNNPAMGKITRVAPYRRLLISQTEWGIFYAIAGRRIVVSTILDLRQHPIKIEQRLRDLLP